MFKNEKVLVSAGKITGLRGLKGELKVSPFLLNLSVFSSIKKIYLDPKGEESYRVLKAHCNPKKFQCFLILEGVDFEKANLLVGKTVYINLEELEAVEEEEFYYYQLLGAEVRDKEGKVLGKVKEIMPSGEYELLLIEGQKGEFYFPLVEEYVEELLISVKKIIVKESVEGLIKVQL